MKAPARVYYCLQGKGALAVIQGLKKKSATVLSMEPLTIGLPRIANVALVTAQ